jgi:2-dehydropantoate 2-reductase
MRLLVVGAGSTGGYFGGRLAQADRDVTFLVRAARAAQLREHGLEIVGPHGDTILLPKVTTAVELKDPFDSVLLTVKGFGLKAAMDDLAPAVGSGTVILPVLNGMRHVQVLKDRFGETPVGGCVCKCATTLDDNGRIVQLTEPKTLLTNSSRYKTPADAARAGHEAIASMRPPRHVRVRLVASDWGRGFPEQSDAGGARYVERSPRSDSQAAR